jgi:hypothetical protein
MTFGGFFHFQAASMREKSLNTPTRFINALGVKGHTRS